MWQRSFLRQLLVSFVDLEGTCQELNSLKVRRMLSATVRACIPIPLSLKLMHISDLAR